MLLFVVKIILLTPATSIRSTFEPLLNLVSYQFQTDMCYGEL